MPVTCPECRTSLDRVIIFLNMAAEVQADGTIVIPEMISPAQMKYQIEQMGEEIIICPECDSAMFQMEEGTLKSIPIQAAKAGFIAKRLGKGPDEAKTIEVLLETLAPETLNFYATFFRFKK